MVAAEAVIQVVQETVVKAAAAADLAIIKVVVVVVLAGGAATQQLTQTTITDQELPMMYQAKDMVLVHMVYSCQQVLKDIQADVVPVTGVLDNVLVQAVED